MFKYEPIEVDPTAREISRRRFLRNVGMGAVAVPSLGALVAACSSTQTTTPTAKGHGPWGDHPAYKFTFVDQVTTNPFFVPCRYGAQDACTLLGCTYQWTGSENAIASEMVSAMNIAIAAKVDGISVVIIDPTAFNAPVAAAAAVGIPTIAFNADAPPSSHNKRMAYVGQDLFTAGQKAGERILPYVRRGDLVGGFISAPGALTIQPRIDGAKSVLEANGVNFVEVGVGTLVGEQPSKVEAWYLGHQNAKFLYAVGTGAGMAVAYVLKKYNLAGKVGGSAFDVAVPILEAVKDGILAFSIDQQSYLQGFIPVLQLYMYQISGGLLRPCDTDTGLGFITTANVGPYLSIATRYEGSTPTEKVLTPPKAIVV